MSDYQNLIFQAIKDQIDIFGEDLFYELDFDIAKKKNEESLKGEKGIFMTTRSLFEKYWECDSLKSLYDSIHECKKCPLGHTRTNFVFGVGNENADVIIIGEAPGAEEDKQGIPFVGRAGKLLTDILNAIKFERDEVYIANILKCRPPNNRNPLPAEMDECTPYLYKQIELIKPKVILCMGLVAANSLLKQKSSLTKLRGNIYEIQGIKTMVTYHPAALLRNPNWKRGCWEDVQKFRKLYDELSL
jgi:DNA polymerase